MHLTRPTERRTAPAGRIRASPATGRWPELDVLRFAAALAVVGFHFFFRAGSSADPLADTGFDDPPAMFRYGYLGVDMFFVVSGFVVVRSAWSRPGAAFFGARIGRLYPAFWVACTITALVVQFAWWDHFQVEPGQWLANLTMVSETFHVDYVDGVYWTLAVELAFYLVVGLATLAGGLSSRRVLIGVAGWLGFCVAATNMSTPRLLRLLLVPEWASFFLAGAVLAVVARDGWGPATRWLFLATAGWSLWRGVDYAASLQAKYGLTFSPLVVLTVIGATLVVVAALASGWRVPAAARIAGLGALTYPLYLVHENIGFALFTAGNTMLGLNRWLVLAAVLASVTGLAWLLHVAVEERFARPLAGHATAVLARSGQALRDLGRGLCVLAGSAALLARVALARRAARAAVPVSPAPSGGLGARHERVVEEPFGHHPAEYVLVQRGQRHPALVGEHRPVPAKALPRYRALEGADRPAEP